MGKILGNVGSGAGGNQGRVNKITTRYDLVIHKQPSNSHNKPRITHRINKLTISKVRNIVRGKQTNKLTNRQTNKQTNKQTSAQANKQTKHTKNEEMK